MCTALLCLPPPLITRFQHAIRRDTSYEGARAHPLLLFNVESMCSIIQCLGHGKRKCVYD